MNPDTFCVSRRVWSDPQFKNEPFTEREAWIWLVGKAYWKNGNVRVGRHVIQLERGQYAASTRGIADVWGWSRAKVRRFLDRLESDGNIIRTLAHQPAHKSAPPPTLITVCNYAVYQFGQPANDTTNRPTERPLSGPPTGPKTGPSKSAEICGVEGEVRPTDRPIERPNIIDNTITYVMDAPDGDAKEILFEGGLSFLQQVTGKREADCRKLLGQWLKNTKNDASHVLDLLRKCQSNQVADPVSWMMAATKPKEKPLAQRVGLPG